jgi:SET domain-containing protein
VPPADPVAAVEISRIAGRGLFATRPLAAGTELDLDLAHLNHSCEPNVGWTATGALVAMRDVGEGAELTTDYALHIDDPGFVLTCHCETYRCRQVIEGTDWQIPQLQKRYAGFWAPPIRQRIEAAGG